MDVAVGLHATMEGALSDTITMVSLSTVPRLLLLSGQSCCLRVGKQPCGGRRTVSLPVSPPTDLAMRSRSHRDQMTLRK